MEELSTFINFIGHKALLMTLIPSLFLNVIIDIVKKYIGINSKNEEKLAVVSILCFLGLVFGFLYYYIGGINLTDSSIHAGFITITSYFFYKVDIYRLLFDIVKGVMRKLGILKDEAGIK